jgi:hypothetical protein
MQLREQYVIATYPFVHNLDAPTRLSRLRALDGRWAPWWTRLDQQAIDYAIDDSYFFLPYVRSLLFPELATFPEAEIVQQREAVLRDVRAGTSALAEQLDEDGVLRLTLADAAIAPLRQLTISGKNDQNANQTVQVDVCWIDLFVLPRAGFLTLKLQLAANQPPDHGALFALLNGVRRIYGANLASPPTPWQIGATQTPIAARTLVDFLLLGFAVPLPAEGLPTLASFQASVDAGNHQYQYSLTSAGQVYGDSFRLYCYAHLDMPADQPAAPFPSTRERLLYDLTNGRASGPDTIYEPHPQRLNSLFADHGIQLWAGWSALALPDRVCFLAYEPASAQVIAHTTEHDYFWLYLLALYQKLRLSMFAGEMMRNRDNLHADLINARVHWSEFIRFRNHYWFVEVTPRPQGDAIYDRFQHGLGVSELYSTISEEVHQLQEFYEQQAQRNTEMWLGYLTIAGTIIAVPSLLTQLYSTNLLSAPTLWDLLVHSGLGYAVLLMIFLLVRLRSQIRPRPMR